MNRWPALAEFRSLGVLAVPIMVATRTPIAAAGTAIVARGDNGRWDSHGGTRGTTAGTAMKHGPASVVAGTAIGLAPPRDSHQNGATRGQPLGTGQPLGQPSMETQSLYSSQNRQVALHVLREALTESVASQPPADAHASISCVAPCRGFHN